jgi:hypothetical protein
MAVFAPAIALRRVTSSDMPGTLATPPAAPRTCITVSIAAVLRRIHFHASPLEPERPLHEPTAHAPRLLDYLEDSRLFTK